MSRIFKIQDEEQSHFILLEASEITKKVNGYGNYRERKDGKPEVIEKECFFEVENSHSFDPKEFVKLSEISFDYDDYTATFTNKEDAEKFANFCGYYKLDDEDCYVSEDTTVFETVDGINFSETVCSVGYEAYEYWDGSNWIETMLTSDEYDTECEEITDELGEDFEDKLQFLFNRKLQAASSAYHIHLETKKCYNRYNSHYQGSGEPAWTEVTLTKELLDVENEGIFCLSGMNVVLDIILDERIENYDEINLVQIQKVIDQIDPRFKKMLKEYEEELTKLTLTL